MKWLFNRLMIWGAVLGLLIFVGAGKIQDAWYHHGYGYISYEQPDRTVRAPENKYKRYEYVMGGMLLLIGLFVWILIAKDEKDRSKKRELLR